MKEFEVFAQVTLKVMAIDHQQAREKARAMIGGFCYDYKIEWTQPIPTPQEPK